MIIYNIVIGVYLLDILRFVQINAIEADFAELELSSVRVLANKWLWLLIEFHIHYFDFFQICLHDNHFFED